jgi:hypothetical protein
MEAEAKADVQVTQGPEQRRTRPRFAVDQGAVLLLVSHGLPVQCRIVDLSLEGCRVRTLERFPTGAGVHVEVTFKVKGIAFRFGGAIQWMGGIPSQSTLWAFLGAAEKSWSRCSAKLRQILPQRLQKKPL